MNFPETSQTLRWFANI